MRKWINFSQVRASFPHKISKENMNTTSVTPSMRKREIKRSVKICKRRGVKGKLIEQSKLFTHITFKGTGFLISFNLLHNNLKSNLSFLAHMVVHKITRSVAWPLQHPHMRRCLTAVSTETPSAEYCTPRRVLIHQRVCFEKKNYETILRQGRVVKQLHFLPSLMFCWFYFFLGKDLVLFVETHGFDASFFQSCRGKMICDAE